MNQLRSSGAIWLRRGGQRYHYQVGARKITRTFYMNGDDHHPGDIGQVVNFPMKGAGENFLHSHLHINLMAGFVIV